MNDLLQLIEQAMNNLIDNVQDWPETTPSFAQYYNYVLSDSAVTDPDLDKIVEQVVMHLFVSAGKPTTASYKYDPNTQTITLLVWKGTKQ